MNTDLPCPDCGAPLPPESPQALCPACLLRQAMASRTQGIPTETPPGPTPTPEEIAAHFPQFEIRRCLGRGGMGVVYQAKQKSLDRDVAIKILDPGRVGDADFAERFTREARMLAKLSHPNIVAVHDHGEADGLFYIVMELVDGVNLRDLLREGKLDPEQALSIVPPICEALEYAHNEGVVHRDIKPENLLLDRTGRIKIADFGIASLAGAGGEAAGTPPYMAPEQADGGRADRRADVHALGAVLYELLTGEPPRGNFAPPSQKTALDPRLDRVVQRAMERDPDRRYQTAGNFGSVIKTISATPPHLPPAATPPRKGAFSRYWWLYLVMIPAGMLLGLVAGLTVFSLVPKKYEAAAVYQVRGNSSNSSMATWIEATRSGAGLREVAARLDLQHRWKADSDASVRTLRSILSVNSLPGTSLIEVRVRFNNPQDAADIANTTVNVLRDRASKDQIILHEMAQTSAVAVSPNSTSWLLLGSGAGFLASPLLATTLILWLLGRKRGSRAGVS